MYARYTKWLILVIVGLSALAQLLTGLLPVLIFILVAALYVAAFIFMMYGLVRLLEGGLVKKYVYGFALISLLFISTYFVNITTLIEWSEGPIIYRGSCMHTMDMVDLTILERGQKAYLNSGPFTYQSRRTGEWHKHNDTIYVQIINHHRTVDYWLEFKDDHVLLVDNDPATHDHKLFGNFGSLKEL